MDLKDKAMEFVGYIKRTREFEELKRAKKNIDRYEKLRNEVEEYQKLYIKLHTMEKGEKEAKSTAEELNKRFNRLSKIPEIDRYLKALKKFNDMMFNFYKTISTSLESELKSK